MVSTRAGKKRELASGDHNGDGAGSSGPPSKRHKTADRSDESGASSTSLRRTKEQDSSPLPPEMDQYKLPKPGPNDTIHTRNVLEVDDLIFEISRHLAHDGDFLSVFKLGCVNKQCLGMIPPNFRLSLESLRLELSVEHIVWLDRVFNSRPDFCLLVRNVSINAPPPGRAWPANLKRRLHNRLVRLLNLWPNLERVEVTRLSEFRNVAVWPPPPNGPPTKWYWEIVICALASSNAPIRTISNLPIEATDSQGRPYLVFWENQKWCRENPQLWFAGMPLTCFDGRFVCGHVTWQSRFQNLRNVYLHFDQDQNYQQPHDIRPLFEQGMRLVETLIMYHDGEPNGGAKGMSELLDRYPWYQQLR